jgi:LuxR family transcriptional regulator, quorum-sensing system regulator CviR
MHYPDDKKISDVLSKTDAFSLIDIIYTCVSCKTEKDFQKLVLNIRKLISFDYAACLMGTKSKEDVVTKYDLINISYPDEWLYHYVTKQYHLVDPVVKENFTNYSIQYWLDTYKKFGLPKKFVMEAEDFNLRKGYSIGHSNLNATEGSLFSFAGNNVDRSIRTELILMHVTPHLHQAFNKLMVSEVKCAASLTPREKEIIHWMKEGKSTWDISMILCISQDTVKFHLKNIFKKLNVTNRPQAVAVALATNLIEL